MAVETDEDRAIFIDPDEFGVPVIWYLGSSPYPFNAIFDAEYQLLTTPLLDSGAEGSEPQIQCRDADLPPQASQGDAVSVAGKNCKAVEIKSDGTGMTVIRLQEV
ncbi:hypothetical protein [Aminobacter aminovorans]|uniref:head-tail joining protein n=1 Tax=Aminobacter aminovorans TaxID=83263 RepID=UPI00285DA638|nr:hypothetical protein [Aminobacter aminovorans]MDR7220354.1 hypothetical protein [Aminobacter aminovorans]